MPAQLDLYQQLSALHDEMAAAALALDWDRLILLEQQSAALTLTLQKSPLPPLGQEERTRMATLIQHIVEKQNFIREEIKVWQGDTAPLLTALNHSHSS